MKKKKKPCGVNTGCQLQTEHCKLIKTIESHFIALDRNHLGYFIYESKIKCYFRIEGRIN